jgi:hypothetical protein
VKHQTLKVDLAEPIYQQNDVGLDFFGIKQENGVSSTHGGFSNEYHQKQKTYKHTNASLKLEATLSLT